LRSPIFNQILTGARHIFVHFATLIKKTKHMSDNAVDIKALNEQIEKESAFIDILTLEMNKVIVGQQQMVERLLIGLLGQGHILLEGVPGLAKTLAINTLSKAVKGSFSRIQFTPDLLPADVIGTMIYNAKENDFSIKKGPVFANFVLADEINRAPAKVQSALLEAMQEKQVTIGDETFKLKPPFLVMATQNPVEQEGTYPLPEAQVDRFMLKVIIDYPNLSDEQAIVRANLNDSFGTVKPVISTAQISKAQKAVREVYMDEKIEKYILDLVFATRYPEKYKLQSLKPLISFGASPRGSINLATAAKCYAFIKRRGYVIPEDVRAVVYDVLRHRIGITYEAEAESVSSEDIIQRIVNAVEVP
jgi:MoxR-like ATPase